MWDREPLAFLSSGGLAVGLLLLLVLLLGIYLFVPQSGPGPAESLDVGNAEMGPAARLDHLLGFTDIRRSGWLYGTCALLAINLMFCLIRRFTIMRLLLRFPQRIPSSIPTGHVRTIPRGDNDPQRIATLLRRKGYCTLVGERAVYGLRGRHAVIGHWLFHASLLLLLGAGAYVAASPSPFRGVVGIGEGESFDLHSAPFLGANAPVTDDLPGLRFHLDSIDLKLDGEEVRGLEAGVSTSSDGGGRIAINHPFRRSPYQVMVHGFGYMPGWVIVDQAGTMLTGAWVKLVPFPSIGEDAFRIGPRTSEVTVRFYPDYQETDGAASTASHEPRNPRFLTRITLLEETIFDGLVEPGERVALGGGREFFFLPEIRRYMLVDVIREREHLAVFAFLTLMVLGLSLRYLRLRKEILVQFDDGWLRLSGRGEILEDLFEEELERLSAELQKAGDVAPGVRRAIA
jgi:hypothetical protein